jgi:hypothetical protein
VSRALAVVLLLAAGACQSVTEIVVRVDSDLAAGAAFAASDGKQGRLSAVSFVLEDLAFATPIDVPEPEPTFTSCVPLSTAGCFPVELGAVARGDWSGRDFGIEVRGLSECSTGAPTTPYLVARARAVPRWIRLDPARPPRLGLRRRSGRLTAVRLQPALRPRRRGGQPLRGRGARAAAPAVPARAGALPMTAARACVCIAVLLATLVAHADPRAPDALSTSAARAHYDAGRAYFEQGDYRRALAEFQSAQHDDDRPALDYNIATCYEHLDDPARAVRHLRRYLERESSIPERPALEDRITALAARTGELELRSLIPGVIVTVDGEAEAPGAVVRLSAGAHRVVATKEGYYGRSIEVVVVAGQRGLAEVDPIVPAEQASRRRRRLLAIGLGVAGGALLVGAAVTLGVVFGTRAREAPYVGNVGVLVVNP